MRLHAATWGGGDTVALLLHGMGGSAEGWWRVGPALAATGYRVIALDLPGHGLSPRALDATVQLCADAVVETLFDLTGRSPDLAIGHSFGGMVLAASVSLLRPGRAVYVDAPFVTRGGSDFESIRAEYELGRTRRSYEFLREHRPSWSEDDCRVEALASERFDPGTAAAIAASAGGDWTPSAPPASIAIRPVPSDYIDDRDADSLRDRGVTVRDIPGAAHSVWYSHFNEFMTAVLDPA